MDEILNMDKIIEPKLEELSKKQLLEKIRQLQSESAGTHCTLNGCDIRHELEVHQIELEMQNRAMRESQLQLEEARDSYADLYDFAPVNYVTFDNKGRVVNINLTGTGMLGDVRTNIIGQFFSRWLEIRSTKIFHKHIEATLESDKKIVDEVILKNKTKEQLEVRIESIRYKDSETNKYFIRSVILDITDSNRIKNEIFLQARQLKLITDALPLLIAYVDNNEQHLFVNKTYADTFNFLPKDVVGKSTRQIWGDSTYNNVKKHLMLAFAGQEMKADIELPLSNMEKKYFRATFIPDVDYNSQVYGVIILIGDITDRLAIEAIDRKRLLDIAHFSRLSSMGEMASEIAHELNQPLAAISIYSDASRRMILSGKYEQEGVIQAFADISEQAERAGDVIRRMREFVSKKELHRTETDLNKLIHDALHLLEIELREHNVLLELDLAEYTPHILVDKILIEQVVFNLARNALEAMDDVDENQRLIKIHSQVTTSKEIEVLIEDSGPGLPAEYAKKLFEPFFSTKANGMGMGLAISLSIIEAHHGRLWTVPNDQGGTIFSFRLPLISE